MTIQLLKKWVNSPGAVLADQVKNLDWRSRQARYKGKVNASEMHHIKAKIAALLQFL